jgi:hypothetical protein
VYCLPLCRGADDVSRTGRGPGIGGVTCGSAVLGSAPVVPAGVIAGQGPGRFRGLRSGEVPGEAELTPTGQRV